MQAYSLLLTLEYFALAVAYRLTSSADKFALTVYHIPMRDIFTPVDSPQFTRHKTEQTTASWQQHHTA